MRARLLWPSLLAFAGCAEPAGDPPDGGSGDDCRLVASLGHGGAGDAFVPFADGDEAELVLGVQGFRFVYVVLRLEGAGAARFLATFEVGVQDHDPHDQAIILDMVSAGDGAVYSDDLMIFFNAVPYEETVERLCDLGVRLDSGDCRVRAGVRVRIVDEDPCLHVPGDTWICGDAGPDAGDAGDAGG